MEKKVLVVSNAIGVEQMEIFKLISEMIGNNFCYCSLSICDGIEWEKFSEIWTTKSTIRRSSTLRKLSKIKNVYIIEKNKIKKYNLAFKIKNSKIKK